MHHLAPLRSCSPSARAHLDGHSDDSDHTLVTSLPSSLVFRRTSVRESRRQDNRIGHQLMDFGRGHRFRRRFSRSPLVVIWELTHACHLACVHCREAAILSLPNIPSDVNEEEVGRLTEKVGIGSPRRRLSGLYGSSVILNLEEEPHYGKTIDRNLF